MPSRAVRLSVLSFWDGKDHWFVLTILELLYITVDCFLLSVSYAPVGPWRKDDVGSHYTIAGWEFAWEVTGRWHSVLLPVWEALSLIHVHNFCFLSDTGREYMFMECGRYD
jgi:hypothetical protein